MSTPRDRDSQSVLFEDRVDRLAMRIRLERRGAQGGLLTLDEARAIARGLLQQTVRDERRAEHK